MKARWYNNGVNDAGFGSMMRKNIKSMLWNDVVNDIDSNDEDLINECIDQYHSGYDGE